MAGMSKAGAVVRRALEDFLGEHRIGVNPVEELAAGRTAAGFDDEVVSEARERVLRALGSSGPAASKKGISAEVLRAFIEASGDPDYHLPEWLEGGAPIGILNDIPLAGIFPDVQISVETDTSLSELVTLEPGWVNYASVEKEPDTVNEVLSKAVEAGFCRVYDTRRALEAAAGTADIVYNKLALISKERDDGTMKHRVIWDMLRSRVNEQERVGERIVLPKVSDAVKDAVDLVRAAGPGETLEWFVIDVADAFHNVPIHESEWRFCCARVGDKFYMFVSLVFGSKSSVPLWGRFAAWLGRSTASLFVDDLVRLQIYVDDPLVAVVGSAARRIHLVTIAFLWAAVAGYPLAWGKGSSGIDVAWIGAAFHAGQEYIMVRIPARKIEELLAETNELLSLIVVQKQRLRSYCGKVSFVAGLVVVLRPFLAGLWAPLGKDQSRGRASFDEGGTEGAGGPLKRRLPDGLVHVRRIRHTLRWLRAFLLGECGALERKFPRQPPAGPRVRIAVDASPWGIGAVLIVGGSVTEWLAGPIQEQDLRMFNAKRGVSDHMTTWEALGLLVAVRTWLPRFPGLQAEVRSDSLGALRMVAKMTSPAAPLMMIARELALDLAAGVYDLEVVTHVPGIANVMPDALSRLEENGVPSAEAKPLPASLAGVPRAPVGERNAAFWRSAAKATFHAQGVRGGARPVWGLVSGGLGVCCGVPPKPPRVVAPASHVPPFPLASRRARALLRCHACSRLFVNGLASSVPWPNARRSTLIRWIV